MLGSVLQSSDACLEKFPTAGNPPTELFAAAGCANGGNLRKERQSPGSG
ncbi:MAG: hypothetical protein KME40_32185 [Komarekiella atlantica HA4396-MV6]|nr:hypothetical protein [Komarekiella atlantica HA4396-MV6]